MFHILIKVNEKELSEKKRRNKYIASEWIEGRLFFYDDNTPLRTDIKGQPIGEGNLLVYDISALLTASTDLFLDKSDEHYFVGEVINFKLNPAGNKIEFVLIDSSMKKIRATFNINRKEFFSAVLSISNEILEIIEKADKKLLADEVVTEIIRKKEKLKQLCQGEL